MDTRQSIEIRSERIKKGINKAFGCKAETLEKALRTVGRRLPKRVRKKVSLVTTAESMGGHPKLIQRIDGVALAVAEKEKTSRRETSTLRHKKIGNWILRVA